MDAPTNREGGVMEKLSKTEILALHTMYKNPEYLLTNKWFTDEWGLTKMQEFAVAGTV